MEPRSTQRSRIAGGSEGSFAGELPAAYWTRSDTEGLASQIMVTAIGVHGIFGPGLLKSAYQSAKKHELKSRNIQVKVEDPLAWTYRGPKPGTGSSLDMVVGGGNLHENKTVGRLLPIHAAQLRTHLKHSGLHLGFLFNWNTRRIKDGFKRLVLDYNQEAGKKPV